MSNIFILSAPIQSGKTTALMEFWEMGTVSCDGFITPDIDDSRKIIFLDTDEEVPFQVEENFKGEIVEIGQYKFSKESFELMKKKLKNLNQSSSNLIIIDEIGPLELRGAGFEPEFFEFLNLFKSEASSRQLIIVVRNTLLLQMIEKYGLQDAHVLSLHKFTDLFLEE